VVWRLRGKQLHGVQFYRQKPMGDYVKDEMGTSYLEKQGAWGAAM
jgi:very-short-patch-repair endonuclease